MFSDESTFSSGGVVNRHNSHCWAGENPRWMMERRMQGRWSINVWCGIVNQYVVGPHFFDGKLVNILRHSVTFILVGLIYLYRHDKKISIRWLVFLFYY